MHYPEHLLKLIALFKKLPGIGTKSAERFAFHLLDWPEEKLAEMGNAITCSKQFLKRCPTCGCLTESTEKEICDLCDPSKRDQEILCIVATFKDVFSIEETREYKGLYHVLGGLFSPIHGQAPAQEAQTRLKKRLATLPIKEVVMALDSTLEGDATALYLKRELSHLPVNLSRLALGMPMGSSFDYIDGGTLARAFAGRHSY